MRLRNLGWIAIAFAGVVTAWGCFAKTASAADSVTVQEILDGNQLYIDQQQARVHARARSPQLVSTKQARAQLLFNTGAAGRLSHFSLLKLGSSCFLMQQGQILVSGQQNGCTRSARMSVRGTNYLIDVQDDGSSELSVLEGSVEVEPLRDGEATGDPSVVVEAGQKVRISPVGVLLSLVRLSQGDYERILGGSLFSGFTTPLPGLGSLERYLRINVPGVRVPSGVRGELSLPSVPSVPSIPTFGF